MLRYRFEFVEDDWPPDHVFRDEPIIAGAVEMYAGQRYLVEAVDETTSPPIAVLGKQLT